MRSGVSFSAARSAAQRAANPAARNVTGTSGGLTSWAPSRLGSDVIQWSLAGGNAYETETLDNYAVLRCLESYGTFRKPRAGRCGLFDGTNDYATLGARLTSGTLSTLTVCARVKKTNDSGLQIIASEWLANPSPSQSWMIGWDSGQLTVWVDQSGDYTARKKYKYAGLSTGTWYHVAFTFNAGVLKLYVDGVEVTPTTKEVDDSITTIFNSSAQFRIGNYDSLGYHNGSICDVRVYSPVKTAAELLAIKNQANTPETVDHTGILGHWWGNEEAGNKWYDCSGNGKDLTLTNISTLTFHAADTGVDYSAPNYLGHGGGLWFDGTDDYAALNARISSGTQTAFSVAFWLRTSDAGGTICEEYATSNRAWSLYLFNGKLYLTTSADGSAVSDAYYNGGTINDGVWRHVVVTYSAGTVAIYFNGVSQTVTGTGTASIYNTTSGFTVGGLNGNSYLASAVSDLRFYNVAKSSSEAAAINSGTNDTTGLLGRWSGKRDLSGNGKHLELKNGAAELIIPRNEASDSVDAAGIPLQYTGRSPHPQVVETPCITGDGTNVYGSLGAIGSASNFTADVYYYHASSATRQRLVDCRNDAGTYVWSLLANAENSGTVVANKLHAQISTGTTDFSIVNALTVGNWHKITFSRSGNTWTLACVNLSTDASLSATTTNSQTFDSASQCFLLGGANVGGSVVTSLPSSGRLAQFSIAQSGVTTYFPLDHGPGASNTNRTIWYLRDDGTYGEVANAIVNGTVSTIWSNRCPGYARDWCTQYGGRLTTENQFKYSEQFGNSPWNAVGITANATTDPNGGTTADLLSFTGSGQQYQTVSGSSGIYTLSVYVKKAAYRYFSMQIEEGATAYRAVFDLDTATSTVNANTSATMTDAGNGWYRCSVTNTVAATPGFGTFQQSSAATFALGTGTNTFYLWGAQFEAGSTAETYQPTTSAAVSANVFIPGQISGSLCADGRAKTLNTSGTNKHGNPGSRRSPNPWDAPEMRAIGYTPLTLYAPGDDVQSVSPADTKYRRDGADGEDRTFAVSTALTGTDKTNAEAYVA